MKTLAALAILILALPACADSLIGLFADEGGDQCWASIEPYVEIELHVLVFLDPYDFYGGLTAAEFRLENWPGNPGYPLGMVTANWNSDLLLGELDDDFSIAFSAAQPGPIVELGTLSLQMFSEDWIEDGQQIVVGPGNDCSCIVLVDELFEIYDADGLQFTFNCEELCSCIPGGTPIQSNWSHIKSMY
ncbi:hypothetical protein H8E52_01275 [bacterium]|nr:hypothetical protein [bacterium]